MTVDASRALSLVIDTNIVLDLFVFADPASAQLRTKLEAGHIDWFATIAMRDELQRVLGYPQIASRLLLQQLDADVVMAQFDRHARLVAAPGKAPITCSDADDQKFVDLAIACKCLLLSKDGEVLTMGKRMLALEAAVATEMPPSSYRLSDS
jgi:predicted nucleic acid-binding protein